MVDAREAAHDAASKIMSKSSRWRNKLFSNSSSSNNDDAPKQPSIKPAQSFKLDDDVNAFLKPSTDKAQQHRDQAAAYLVTASRPRIDVSKAQRWPAAQDILTSAAAAGKSPGPGGMRTGTRKKGLSVGFVRAVPEIIGHGGDECDEPAVEVSKRKKAGVVAQAQPQKPQDDANLGTGVGRTPSQTEQRNSLTRTLTSHGEISPPLGRKLEMGHINSHAQAPPPLPQHMGAMGLGERPRPLSRAPTGFDNVSAAPLARNPSDASSYSQDSDNMSPVLTKKTSNVEPTIQEEDFRPKPLSRTQTGFSEYAGDSDDEPVPPVPAIQRLPELNTVSREDESPLDARAMLADRFLESEPTEPNSFSARVKQRMRSEEGRALHEAAQRQHMKQDSDTSSMQSTDPGQYGVSPPTFTAYQPNGRSQPQTAPEIPARSPFRSIETDDPHRSRARASPPARKAMPPGSYQLDTDVRPASSGSSQFSMPQTRGSPSLHFEPLSATTNTSTQQIPPIEKAPLPAVTQHSIPPSSQQFKAYTPPAQQPPPPPPAHGYDPRAQVDAPGQQLPVRPRQDTTERSGAPLSRSDTKMLGEATFNDFADRVVHMKGIFQLTAQLGGQLYDKTPMQWLRAATWWFLRGRAGMESLIRSRPKTAEPQPERLTQPHVDLAKVLWILTEVLPNHPNLQPYGGKTVDSQADRARQAGDTSSAEAFEIQSAILHYMKLLVGSMRKHQSMPPTQALIQGQDQSIWEEYPIFAPDAGSVLQAGTPRSDSAAGSSMTQPRYGLSQYIPLADTKTDFCYFRMFAKASMSTDDPNTDRVPMSAVISVLRPKDLYQVKLAICSQNESINIILGPSADGGPSWNDVNWKKQSNQITVLLRHGFTLTIDLTEGDWRNLWAIVDHTNRVQMDLRERKEERFSCKLQLREASYRDPGNPAAFPPGRVQGCKLMVFEKIERSSEGTGKRKLHRGYRMVLYTTAHNKQVSLVNLDLGSKQAPMNFEYVTEPDQAPGMRLAFREEGPDKKMRVCAAHLIFQESKDRNHLFGTFTSMNLAEGETTFAQVPLKSFVIESADQAEGFSAQGSRVLERLQWQEAKVVNQDPEAAGLEAAPTVMSESLRIVCRHSAGIISDRMNLGKLKSLFEWTQLTVQALPNCLSVFR